MKNLFLTLTWMFVFFSSPLFAQSYDDVYSNSNPSSNGNSNQQNSQSNQNTQPSNASRYDNVDDVDYVNDQNNNSNYNNKSYGYSDDEDYYDDQNDDSYFYASRIIFLKGVKIYMRMLIYESLCFLYCFFIAF